MRQVNKLDFEYEFIIFICLQQIELMPSLIETTTMAATVTTTIEVTTDPSSMEVSSTQTPCVSGAEKAFSMKPTLLSYALSFILLAYFIN